MNTSVILACVKPFDPSNQITEVELQTLFGTFANVVDVFIFEQEPVVKAFIQFENEDVATKVIETFNERLFNIGSVRLYNSRKNGINCKKKRWLRTTQKLLPPNPTTNSHAITNNCVVQSQFKNEFSLDVPQTTSMKPSPVRDSGLDIPSRSSLPVNPANLFLPAIQNHASKSSVQTQPYQKVKNLAVNLDYDLKGSSDFKVSSCGSHKCPELPGFELRNISFKMMNQNTLLNLLSCCGTVTYFHFDNTTQSAIVRFANKKEFSRVKSFLHGLELFESQLKVVPLKQSLLPQRIGYVSHSENQSNSSESDDERYPSDAKMTRPQAIESNVIRFDNLPYSCTPLVLFDIISQIREPRKIIRLTERSTNTSIISVEFDTFLMSLEVLIVLNGKRFDGNVVRVSFVSNSSFT